MNRGRLQGLNDIPIRPPSIGLFDEYDDITDEVTIVGWSSFTEKMVRIKQIGSLYFLTYNLSGTSNSTSTTLTFPSNYQIFGLYSEMSGGLATNNGTINANGCVIFTSGTNTLSIGLAHNAGAWTGSGTKQVIGQTVLFRRHI